MISLPFVFITLPLFYKVIKYSLAVCVLSNVGFLKNAPWLLCVLSSHVMCYLSVSCLMLAVQVSVGILDGLSTIGWLVYLSHSPGECACVFILPLC